MSEPLPDDPQQQGRTEAEAHPPVAPPVQGGAPVANDELGLSAPTTDQLAMEARARQALHQAAAGNSPSAADPVFHVERGGRSAMEQTAGRIGTAVGTAQREVRRKLELVRRPSSQPVEFPSAASASAAAADLADRGARMMQEIDEQTAEIRREASRKLEDWSEQAEERLQRFRRQARTAFWRSGLRAQELAEAYPLQTIAAIACTFFLLGVALRARRSHRG